MSQNDQKVVVEDRGEVLLGNVGKYSMGVKQRSGVSTTFYISIPQTDVPEGQKDPVVTGSGMKVWKLHDNCDDFKPSNDADREVNISKLLAGQKL